jgi:hypothetical protein
MTAAAALARLHALGVIAEVRGSDQLAFRPASAVPMGLLDKLREHKDELLIIIPEKEHSINLLTKNMFNSHASDSLPFPTLADDCRASLLLMAGKPAPLGYPAARWERIMSDGITLLDCWGDQFRTLGWSVLDLFGISPAAPWHAVYLSGLALLLGDDRVEAVTATTARIVTCGGVGQSFTHKAMLGVVPVWMLQ